MSWRMGVVVVLTMLMPAAAVFGAQTVAACDQVDWWEAQNHVASLLADGGTTMAELIEDMPMPEQRSAQEVMIAVHVYLRAGMEDEAIAALRELHGRCPELAGQQVQNIYYFSCDTAGAWSVAKAALEIFADSVGSVELGHRLEAHLLAEGWSVDEVDSWLAGMPHGQDRFWIMERLRFNARHGRDQKLVEELSAAIRRDPTDMDAAVAFLDGLVAARHLSQGHWDLAWMETVLEPQDAVHNNEIGERLATLKQWSSAARFFQRALNIELSREELEALARQIPVIVPPQRLRLMFSVTVSEALARCMLELGHGEEAQKLMEDAASLRAENGLGRNALFAGEVQAVSGQRVIEHAIQQEQVQREDDAAYWLERASYYRGRNDAEREEEALKRGLALTQAQAGSENARSRRPMPRSQALSAYVSFLIRQRREQEAVQILRAELRQAPPESRASEIAAHQLAMDLDKHIRAEDEVLWGWLAARPTWSHTEQRLLWRLLQSAAGTNKDADAWFVRAEELCEDQDPSRAATLGWILNRMARTRRSVPLLQRAVRMAEDPELRANATFTLFESYLDLGDWKRAEEIFPSASHQLTPQEQPEWYARIAVCAARSGASGEAIRIWKRLVDISPTTTTGLDILLEHGLEEELIELYEKLQISLPTSRVPAEVLARLRGSSS